MTQSWRRVARLGVTAAVIGAAILTGFIAGGRDAGANQTLVASGDAASGLRAAVAPSSRARASAPVADEPVIRTVTPVVTPPLTTLPNIPALPRPPVEAKDVVEPGIPAFPAVRDPVLQTEAPNFVMPAPLATFEGLNNDDNPGNTLVIPPDTEGDVGPNHYVEWINISFAVYNKTGTKLYGPVAGNTVFTPLPPVSPGVNHVCESTNFGDPLVHFDQFANRWVISQFAFHPTSGVGPYYECVAVSVTDSPLGQYCLYPFLVSPDVFDDYPKMAVWPDGYYFTFAGFPDDGAPPLTPQVMAVERAAMLNCQPAQSVYYDGTNNTALGQSAQQRLLAADVDGATPPPVGEPNPHVMHDDAQDQLEMYEFHVDWTNPASSTFTKVADLAVAPFDTAFTCNTGVNNRECVPQPLIPNRIDNLSTRLMYELNYRNFGTHQSLVVNQTVDVNDVPDHSGIRWYELRNPHGTPTVHQQATHAPAPATQHRFMGSAAMDRVGNLAIGYSFSGPEPGNFPSLRYAGRLADDPLHQLAQGEATLFAGSGSQIAAVYVGIGGPSRWGDYSRLTLDPVDDCTFWYINEYYTSDQLEWFDGIWHTRIGSFVFDECLTATAVKVSRLSARWRGRAVEVSWRTASEVDALGFEVYRSKGAGAFRKISRSLVPAKNAVRGAAYRFVDSAVRRSDTYTYRLRIVDRNGKRSWHGIGSAASRF